ncbi:hypothetical protein D3876_10825 [Sphingomonas cavernae]|uniref:Uncharacterized protein n=2 Tax=Sphingomonas cavernae TaxID=2320861 RepID=A0A418WKY1_9SPHN|nr:hypothetical protein D3876_10825 [Sphingomonas cavernae]
MAVFAGSAVATAILFLPITLLETIVVASGLPKLVPAAAAPLGVTARALCAIGGAAVAMMLTAGGLTIVDRVARALPRRARPEPLVVEEFAPRRRVLANVEETEPRRPIFAESDLGGSFDVPASAALIEASEEPYELVEPVVEEQADLLDLSPIARAMWQVPPRLPNIAIEIEDAPALDEADQGEFAEFAPLEDEPADAPLSEPVSVFGAPTPEAEDRNSLSLTELLHRLETGLERKRRTVAAVPVSEPRPAVRAGSISDMDEALRDALGTLRRMSANSR